MSLESQFVTVQRELDVISVMWKSNDVKGMYQEESYMNFLKEYNALVESMREELIVLRISEKDKNARAVRLLAKLIVLRDTFKMYLPAPTPPRSRQEIQDSKSESQKHFEQFLHDRVRHRSDGYSEVTGEIVSLKEIHKCYKRWCDVKNIKRLIDFKEIEAYCETFFGGSQGKKVYQHLRVFVEEEDVEEFDKEHLENS
jgi:hypothetical protein